MSANQNTSKYQINALDQSDIRQWANKTNHDYFNPSKSDTKPVIEFDLDNNQSTWNREDVYNTLLQQNPHLNQQAKNQLKDWVNSYNFTNDEIKQIINGTFSKKVLQDVQNITYKRKLSAQEKQQYLRDKENNERLALANLLQEAAKIKSSESPEYNPKTYTEALVQLGLQKGINIETFDDLKQIASLPEAKQLSDNWSNDKSYKDFYHQISKDNTAALEKTVAGIVASPVLAYGAATYAPWLLQNVVLPTAKGVVGSTIADKILSYTNLDDKTKQQLSATAGIISGGGINIPSLISGASYLGVEKVDDLTGNRLNPQVKYFIEGALGSRFKPQWKGTTGLARTLDRTTNTLFSGALNAGITTLSENVPYGNIAGMVISPIVAKRFSDKSRIAAIRMQQASQGQEGVRVFNHVIKDFNWKHPFNLNYSPTKSGKYYDFDFEITPRMSATKETSELLAQPGNKRLKTYDPNTYMQSTLLRMGDISGQPIGVLVDGQNGNMAQQFARNHGIGAKRWGTDKIYVRELEGDIAANTLMTDPNYEVFNFKTRQYEPFDIRNQTAYQQGARRDFFSGLLGVNTKGYQRSFFRNKNNPDEVYELGSDVWGTGSGAMDPIQKTVGQIMDGAYNYGTVTLRTKKIRNKKDLTVRNQSQQAPAKIFGNNIEYAKKYRNWKNSLTDEQKKLISIRNNWRDVYDGSLSKYDTKKFYKTYQRNNNIANNKKLLDLENKQLMKDLGLIFVD